MQEVVAAKVNIDDLLSLADREKIKDRAIDY
jgi:hypothetical protein